MVSICTNFKSAPFINGCPIYKFKVGAAPFINGADLKLGHNIYNKLAELQRQIQHHDPHMNSGDTIQIEAPDFDPDINDISSPTMDERPNKLLTQGQHHPLTKLPNLRSSVQPIQHLPTK